MEKSKGTRIQGAKADNSYEAGKKAKARFGQTGDTYGVFWPFLATGPFFGQTVNSRTKLVQK